MAHSVLTRLASASQRQRRRQRDSDDGVRCEVGGEGGNWPDACVVHVYAYALYAEMRSNKVQILCDCA